MSDLIDVEEVFALKADMWPEVMFYDKQIQVIESAYQNVETVVVAANKVGKDFGASFIPVCDIMLCLAKGYTCRVVTTSVAEHHLKVLWGEIGRWITSSRVPLLASRGGPLILNYQEIRLASEADAKNPLSYVVGRVSAKGEGMAGHHADFTRFIGDEASGLDDEVYTMSQGWAKKFLIFGNPNKTRNFFYRGVKGGDVVAPD